MGKYLMPTRIVKAVSTKYEENLLIDKPLQTPLISKHEGDVIKGCTLIKNGGCIIIDFGKEINGGIKIAVQKISDSAAQLKIVFGESVMETIAEKGEKNADSFHSIREYNVPALRFTTQRVGDIGFRFVRIEAHNADIMLWYVKAVLEITDAPEIGMFECDDERINKIWQTAVYTVKLNMQEYLFEGVKRDRLVWIGDLHPEISTVKAVFGKNACVEKSLDFVRDTTPKGEWMNNTGTYSMWWIIIHYDWYMHWGDLEYLEEQVPYLKEICDMAFVWIDEGLCDKEDTANNFVDWSSKNTESEIEGRKAIFCMGMDAASKIFDALNEKIYKKECERYKGILGAECVTYESNKRVSALTVLSGRDSKIAIKTIEGSSPKEMSTFLGYYVLKAKAKLGDYSQSIDLIKNYWGAMLDKGATTFWEDFDIDWVDNSGRIDEVVPEGLKDIHGDFGKFCYTGFRHSLCHGWASGPAPYLMEQIGGIEILEPGCKKVRISPNLGNLEWIKISYPTPYGDIKIQHEVDVNGKVISNVDAPEEIEIIM